jgi:adenylyltransferase/sulfurtransferase
MIDLTDHDRTRYHRQMILPGWGEEAQRTLKRASVTVVGAGGLGSTSLVQLAEAGIGTIRIVDSDRAELSNLNRQILHWEADIGRDKAVSAAEKLSRINAEVHIETVARRLSDDNAADVLGEPDAIVDALDNFEARFAINRFAVEKAIPLFHGAVWGFEGRATTILPGSTPCLRCIYEQVPPSEGEIPVVGVTPAVIAAIQVTETLKYFTGIGELLTGQLLVYDGNSMRFLKAAVDRRRDCPVCGGL